MAVKFSLWKNPKTQRKLLAARQAQSQAVSVQILGATGPHGDLINGVYSPTGGQLYNERALYRKESKDRHSPWLRYTREGKWCVSDSHAKNLNQNAGLLQAWVNGGEFPQDSKDWRVLMEAPDATDGLWTSVPALSVRVFTAEDRAAAAAVLAQAEAKRQRTVAVQSEAVAVVVAGATGEHKHLINGVFRPTGGQLYNGR